MGCGGSKGMVDEEEEKGSDIIFIESDNGKDEVDIQNNLSDYPAPRPHQSNIQLSNNVNFFENFDPFDAAARNVAKEQQKSQTNRISVAEVDARAKRLIGYSRACVSERVAADKEATKSRAPPDCLSSFTKLTDYLCRDIRGSEDEDRLTVRALIVWLSTQVVEDFVKKPANQETPEGFLSLLGQRRVTYATFFTVLCRKSNIKCVKVVGVSKAGDYEPGDDVSDIGDCWTSVYLKDSWHIIHPFWVCRSLIGRNAGGWIKLESGGKAVGKREESSTGYLQNSFKEYYFLPSLNEFSYYCHPDNEKWQLLHNPITREQFKLRPHLRPTFFGMGLELVSEHSCLLQTDNGETLVEIKAPAKTANMVDLWYELFLKEESASGDNEEKMLEAENIPKLVAMLRFGNSWKFRVSFPIAGTFKLCLYGGPHSSALTQIVDFRIDCAKHKENCALLPIDPGRLGFGPGPTSERAGLYNPTRIGGLIQVVKNRSVCIKFALELPLMNPKDVKAQLLSNDEGAGEDTSTSERVKCQIIEEERELIITASVPSDADHVLMISTAETENVVSSLRPVCHYLLSTKPPGQEKTDKRNARKHLRELIDKDVDRNQDLSTRIEELEGALDKCHKVKIADDDLDVISGRKKVDCLKIRKDIRDVYMRRNIDNARKTIKMIRESEYFPLFKTDVEHIERYLKKLETLGTFTQKSPNVTDSVIELSKTIETQEEVKQVVRAFLTLIGENGDLNTWEDIIAVFNVYPDTFHQKVSFRVRHIAEASFERETIAKTELYLQGLKLKSIQKISMAAGTIYSWISDVLSVASANGQTHGKQQTIY